MREHRFYRIDIGLSIEAHDVRVQSRSANGGANSQSAMRLIRRVVYPLRGDQRSCRRAREIAQRAIRTFRAWRSDHACRDVARPVLQLGRQRTDELQSAI